jgi:daunorubicin resistance ABC transporter ATP-binding subunit
MADPAVEVTDLVKRFGQVTALDGIDFEVPIGTVFGLLGPNGAGKTTAVRVLTTITAPDHGTARVLGYDVVREAGIVRLNIGLAGQAAAVDTNLTGAENLRLIGRLAQMSRSEISSRTVELLRRFDLVDAADRPVRTYSGGMRRRLDVAASLVHRPPVLFLDEPTTGLDLQSRGELWQMIRELVDDGTTVLLTTQYLEEADRLADRLAVIDHGKVIAEGTPAELKARRARAGRGPRGRAHTRAARASVCGRGRAAAADARRDRGRTGIRRAPGPRPAGHRNPRRPARPRTRDTVRLTSPDGSRILVDVLRALDSDQVSPTTVAVREPSLDDVFLALTGHRAETDNAAHPGGDS